MRQKLLPLVALTLFLVAAAPAVYASTLKVTLNPSTKAANVTSDNTTDLVLTYPAGSALSRYLGNYSSSITKSGSFQAGSDGVNELGGDLEEHDHGISVQSMNVTYALTAKGNSTTFVLHKQTDISAQVMGVFRIVNGTVKADLSWKAFEVPGDMTLRLGDTDMEVNLVGSAFSLQLGDHPLVLAAIAGMFGGDGLWHSPTLDFASLNSPLSNWTRSYNSVTNTTTYSRTVSGQSNLNASASFNGQKYTLSMRSDPSAQVAVHGYAVASGDTLVVQQTPMALNPTVWVGAGAVALALVGGVIYGLRRRRGLGRPETKTVSTSISG